MPALQASRRLVKSPPELWAEVSDAASLTRHLGEVGEIRITRLEGTTTVAWEGERASGTVELAPAGWGTAVTLTAEPVAAPAGRPPVAVEPETAAEPDPEPEAEPAAAPRGGRLASFLTRLRRRPAEPAASSEPEPVPDEPPVAAAPEPASDPLLVALTGALDSLGAAHHRPFSRG